MIFGPLSTTRYTINGVDVDMVRLPPGRFMDGQGPIRRRQILLSRPFELCVTAVTQALWRSVMGGPWVEAEDRPIEDICWNEVQDFLLRLERLGLTGFRLPTEAEWVWAARCGASTQWSGADRPKAVANASFSHSLLPWGGRCPVVPSCLSRDWRALRLEFSISLVVSGSCPDTASTWHLKAEASTPFQAQATAALAGAEAGDHTRV